jgi:hypothetical protein
MHPSNVPPFEAIGFLSAEILSKRSGYGNGQPIHKRDGSHENKPFEMLPRDPIIAV